MTNQRSPITTEDEALLGALLDGELSPGDEAELLRRLECEPGLAVALDELAAAIAVTRGRLSGVAAVDVDFDGLADVVLASATSVTSAPSGAAVLASLVVDGEATPAQVEQLAQLVQRSGAGADAAQRLADTVEAARAVAPVPAAAVAAGLAAVAARVEAEVVVTERTWALWTAAVDGALSSAEHDELVALVAGARGELVARTLDGQDAARRIGDVLRSAADSAAFVALAQRAGASALQVVAADAARASSLSSSSLSSSSLSAGSKATATSSSGAMSWWTWLAASIRRGLVPLAIGFAGVVAFALVRSPSSTDEVAVGTGPNSPEAVEQAFLEIVGPRLLGSGTTEAAALDAAPLLADNAADVESLDATASTQVFQTPESHITVIWVADLGDDAAREGQGT